MIVEMKKAFKMLKYGYQLKTNIFSAGLLLIVGVFSLLFNTSALFTTSSLYLVGTLYLILAPMFLLQIQFLTLYSHMVKSSGLSRFMEIQFADVFSTIISIVGYAMIIIYTIVKNHMSPDTTHVSLLLAVGILIGVLQLYFSIVYKHYVWGTVFMLIGIITVFILTTFLVDIGILGNYSLSMTTSCILGYVAIIISLLLCALLRRAVYKHSFSKWACGAKLRKEL